MTSQIRNCQIPLIHYNELIIEAVQGKFEHALYVKLIYIQVLKIPILYTF
jgi:hypothetical protein